MFAMAQDFGNITSSNESVVWAIGFTRSSSNVAVRSVDLDGTTQDHQLYYVAAYSNDGDLVCVVFHFIFVTQADLIIL